MRAKERRELFLRVQALANFEPVNMSDCMGFTVREIDRAVRKARSEERAHVLDLIERGLALAELAKRAKGTRP